MLCYLMTRVIRAVVYGSAHLNHASRQTVISEQPTGLFQVDDATCMRQAIATAANTPGHVRQHTATRADGGSQEHHKVG